MFTYQLVCLYVSAKVSQARTSGAREWPRIVPCKEYEAEEHSKDDTFFRPFRNQKQTGSEAAHPLYEPFT
jgi:hypothetical protein